MDNNVFFADRGEAIPVMLANAFRVAWRIGIELEVGPILLHNVGQARHPQHSIDLDERCTRRRQPVAQQSLGSRVEFGFQLQLDHLSAPAALDRAAEGANQILGLFLDLDIAVSQHAKHAASPDLEAGEQMFGKTGDEVLDPDIDRLFTRHPQEARQGRGDQHHLDQLFVLVRLDLFTAHGEQHAQPFVGDEGKGMRRVERLRRDHRHYFVEEMPP